MTKRQLFEEMIDQNLDHVYRYAFTYMKNQQDAEDVASDSVEKALKALPTLREPALMKTWFFRIVINTAKSALKKRAKLVPIEDEALESALEIEAEAPPIDLDFYEILEVL